VVITHGHFLGAVLAVILAAALRTTGLVALVIRRANTNTLSSRCRRRLPGWLACRRPWLRRFLVTFWLLTGTIHGILGTAAGTTVFVALVIGRLSAVVPSPTSFRVVITHGHFLGAVLAVILAAALRTTGLVALVIRRTNTNTLSSWCRRRLLCRLACRCPWLRIGRLNLKRVTSRSLLCCSPCNISASLVASIHAIKAFVVLAAQGIFFVETVAGGLITIVVESNELVKIRALGAGASFLFGTAIALDAKVGATSSFGCDGRVDSLNCAPFVLLSFVIDTDRVVLLATKDIVIPFVVYPRNGARKTLLQR